MPFITVAGLKGKVYVPDHDLQTPRKNPCPGCFSCQMCSDTRCHVCLGQKGHKNGCACETSESQEKQSTPVSDPFSKNS